jgi:death on curing protein
MKNISIEEVVVFQKKIIDKTGGAIGIRDLGLIESALNNALVTFDGQDLYKETEEKISVITFALIKNHGFVDGNKRIGIAVMILLLRLNRISIVYTQEELVNLGLGIADGSLKEEDIQNWIQRHKNKKTS